MKIISLRPRALAFSALAAVFAVVVSTSSAFAATWTGAGTDALWANSANWIGAAVPGASDPADFNNGGSGNTTLDLGAGASIGAVTFNTASVAAYTLGSGAVGSQTLSVGNYRDVTLTSSAGNSQIINANVDLLGASAFVNNNATKTLTLNGKVTANTTGGNQAVFNGTGGNIVVNGGISNGVATGMAVFLRNNANVSFAGVIEGATSVTTASGGDIYTGTAIISGNNTYTGNTVVSSGVVQVTNSSGLGATSAGTTVNGTGQLQLAGGITIGAEALSLSGTGGASDTGALRNISGNNTYGGVVTLAGSSRINSDAGTLTLTGVAGGGGTSSDLTLGGAGNIAFTGGVLNSPGSRALIKDGNGIVTLSGSNTYSGATTISAGTLLVSGGGSINNTSSTSVLSGAALTVNGSVNSAVSVSGVLSGTGTVGAVTVASGGTLAPGNSPGILNVSSLTGTSGAFLSMEIGKIGLDPVAGTDYDQVNSSGAVTLGGMTLNLTQVGGAISLGDKIFLVLNGSGAVGGIFDGLAQNAVFTLGSQDYQISYVADWTGNYATSNMTGGNDVALLAVPEPSTCLLLGLGLMVHVLRRRSRRMAA